MLEIEERADCKLEEPTSEIAELVNETLKRMGPAKFTDIAGKLQTRGDDFEAIFWGVDTTPVPEILEKNDG